MTMSSSPRRPPDSHRSPEAYFARYGSWFPRSAWLQRVRDRDRLLNERWLANTLFHPLFWIRRSLRKQVAAHAGYLKGAVLDAGAGDRPFQEILARHVEQVTAIDWAPCSRLHEVPIEVCADLALIPFRGVAFDGALCTEVLEHVEEPEVVIRELARVMKPGGYLIATVPFVFPVHDVYDFRRLTERGLHRLLTHAGFEYVSSKPLMGSGRTLAGLVGLYLFDLGGYWTRWMYFLSVPLRPLIWMATAALNTLGGLADFLCPSTHLAFGHIMVCRRRTKGNEP